MGYMMLVAACIACGARFSCNPDRVPSLKVRGFREPLCHACADRWNDLHPEAARPIQPGAYEAQEVA